MTPQFLGITTDIARFIILGLPCGGFSARVLTGVEDRAELRASLHAIYSMSDLEAIVADIREKTLDLFRGTDLSAWRGIDDPASDDHIASMLRLSGLDAYWRDEAALG